MSTPNHRFVVLTVLLLAAGRACPLARAQEDAPAEEQEDQPAAEESPAQAAPPVRRAAARPFTPPRRKSESRPSGTSAGSDPDGDTAAQDDAAPEVSQGQALGGAGIGNGSGSNSGLGSDLARRQAGQAVGGKRVKNCEVREVNWKPHSGDNTVSSGQPRSTLARGETVSYHFDPLKTPLNIGAMLFSASGLWQMNVSQTPCQLLIPDSDLPSYIPGPTYRPGWKQSKDHCEVSGVLMDVSQITIYFKRSPAQIGAGTRALACDVDPTKDIYVTVRFLYEPGRLEDHSDTPINSQRFWILDR